MSGIIGILLVVAMVWALMYGMTAATDPEKRRLFESMGFSDGGEETGTRTETKPEAKPETKRAA